MLLLLHAIIKKSIVGSISQHRLLLHQINNHNYNVFNHSNNVFKNSNDTWWPNLAIAVPRNKHYSLLFPSNSESSENLYNLRKLNELPFCLVHAGKLELLKQEGLCNFNFLYYKLMTLGFDR